MKRTDKKKSSYKMGEMKTNNKDSKAVKMVYKKAKKKMK